MTDMTKIRVTYWKEETCRENPGRAECVLYIPSTVGALSPFKIIFFYYLTCLHFDNASKCWQIWPDLTIFCLTLPPSLSLSLSLSLCFSLYYDLPPHPSTFLYSEKCASLQPPHHPYKTSLKRWNNISLQDTNSPFMINILVTLVFRMFPWVYCFLFYPFI